MKRYLPYLLFAAIAITFLPWLGDTLFNTKGEPREAIVALSMVDSGNYILPESCGGDIPYKPPFLAWLIVVCSWITGGVNEISARMPSAISTIAMAVGVYLFVRRRSTADNRADLTAALTTAVTVTAFEVFRAATACRVDMVLTACIVGAILLMFRRRELDGRPRMSFFAILLMTCAVLTKGPVGMVLPCLIVWIYYLLRGDSWLQATGILVLSGLLSLSGYVVWFIAAFHLGGQEFIDLVWEENIGRMTGSMSYESHVNPFYYNFITVIAGMAPYTLLALMTLFAVKYRRYSFAEIRSNAAGISPVTLISLIAVMVTLVFYTIPASKRSVYLLPLYPFLSYFVARMALWLASRRSRVITVYTVFTGVLAVLLPIAVVVTNSVDFSTMFNGLKPETAAYIHGLYNHDISFAGWLCIVSCAAFGMTALTSIKNMGKPRELMWSIVATFGMYWVLSSTAMPAVLNTKSDFRLAAEVIGRYTGPEEKIYSYVSTPMLRFYTAGFYLRDNVVPIQGRRPDHGLLLVGEKDYEEFIENYGATYTVTPLYESTLKSCDIRQRVKLLRFDTVR